jgi:hypothetical protein
MDSTPINEARRGRRGPVEGEHLIGFDGPTERRPGEPMHAPPAPAAGAPTSPPTEQAGVERRLHRASLDRPTPVFGTAQPLHGASGLVRSAAYRIPEHHARHWLLLMTADRVDVLEDAVGALLGWPLSALGAGKVADRLRSNPLPLLAGLVVGALVVSRARARRAAETD